MQVKAAKEKSRKVRTGLFMNQRARHATSFPNPSLLQPDCHTNAGAGNRRDLGGIQLDPTAAIETPKTLEEIRDDSLASRTFAMQLLVGFSVVGSVLTLVGIYGILSLSVASRRRELAIPSAVGAEQKHIRNLIFGEGCRLIAAGVLAGIVLAIVLTRVLRSFLFEVQPSDPTTLMVVGALFVGVALLACWVPVRRAAERLAESPNTEGRRRRARSLNLQV
jgi:hypothetical protein